MAERDFLGHSLCTLASTSFMTQLELYATPRLVVKWMDSSSSLFMLANEERKAHQVAALYLKHNICQHKKSDFQNIKNKTKKKNVKSSLHTNSYIHQTNASRLAANYWRAPSLVLKLCQYYQVRWF